MAAANDHHSDGAHAEECSRFDCPFRYRGQSSRICQQSGLLLALAILTCLYKQVSSDTEPYSRATKVDFEGVSRACRIPTTPR